MDIRPTFSYVTITISELRSILRQIQQVKTFEGRFHPTAERLQEISERGAKYLEDTSDEQLDRFTV